MYNIKENLQKISMEAALQFPGYFSILVIRSKGPVVAPVKLSYGGIMTMQGDRTGQLPWLTDDEIDQTVTSVLRNFGDRVWGVGCHHHLWQDNHWSLSAGDSSKHRMLYDVYLLRAGEQPVAFEVSLNGTIVARIGLTDQELSAALDSTI